MSGVSATLRTHRDAGAEAGAGLRAGGADVVAHGRVLVAGSVQVSHRAWTVGAGEAAGPGRVGACTQRQRGEGEEWAQRFRDGE